MSEHALRELVLHWSLRQRSDVKGLNHPLFTTQVVLFEKSRDQNRISASIDNLQYVAKGGCSYQYKLSEASGAVFLSHTPNQELA